jgi:TonB family protein
VAVEATVAERKANGLPDASPADLQQVQALVEEVHNELIPPAAFRQIFTDLYVKHFTADELDAILTFFQSPVGRKMRGSQAALVQEAMVAGRVLSQKHAPEIQRRVVERAQALDAQRAGGTNQPMSGATSVPSTSLPQPPTKIKDVPPVYPTIARAAKVQGIVVLDAVIGPDGSVQSAVPVSGPVILHQAAVNAVLQWLYTPALVDGRAVSVMMRVTMAFALQ